MHPPGFPARTTRLAPLGVFFGGLALACVFYIALHELVPQGSFLHRAFSGHPIKLLTTGLFLWGLSALGAKFSKLAAEQRALSRLPVPIPPGRRLAIAEVPKLREGLASLPVRMQRTWIVRRLHEGMVYVSARGSAEGLEQRLALMADRDAEDSDSSYELVRTITWAIPILGFLGTVVGITIAIANITPEQLQESLSEVVGGLAIAFDTTALALALSMLIVLAKFLVERAERAVLARVDAMAEECLLHRFERDDGQTQLFLGIVEGVANVVLEATKNAWREQGQLWTKAVQQVGESQVSALNRASEQMVGSLGKVARELIAEQVRQFEYLANRAAELERAVTAAAANLGKAVGGHQTELVRQNERLERLLTDHGRLAELQRSLDANLASLANAQALDNTIHSLAAAVHLLTVRAGQDRARLRSVSGLDNPAEAAA